MEEEFFARAAGAFGPFCITRKVPCRVHEEVGNGEVFAAAEAAAIVGVTNVAQTVTYPEHDVLQALGVVQVGYEEELFTTTLEGGYATGDSNAVDGALRSATFDENFVVGLVLFPEVLAWHSARTAAWARSEDLTGRPARGSENLPTNGSVSGAAYLFPHASVTPVDWLELRVGAIFAWSTAAATNPYRQRAYSENVGPLGGDPTQRYLYRIMGGNIYFSENSWRGVCWPRTLSHLSRVLKLRLPQRFQT